MRIVIDLQSPQGGNKNRGLGRYSLMLAQALAKLGQYHEIWIALNGLFPDAVEHLRKKFEGLVPSERIVVWHAPGPVAACDPANAWRRETAELLREAFITGLKPDIVHVASLFEGWADNCVTSVGKSSERVPVAVTVYDLIPLLYKDVYLSEPQVRAWYYQKLQWLKNAELWLAISEHTRQDVIEQLGLPEDRVVNISAGRDPRFRPIEIDPAAEASLRARYRLNRPFVLYVGGIEPRKNIEGLLKAYALLPKDLRERHQLVVVCDIQELERRRLYELARREGLHQGDVVFPGFVSDEVLIALYNLCKLFVFPSFYEGFGLPPLEAMACGAPVIASNTSSLPEVVGWEKALFDPKRPEAIAEKMQEALTDEVFREALKRHGLEQAKRFSWEESARRALKAFEALHAEQSKAGAKAPFSSARSRKPSLAYLSPLPPARTGIADYSQELLPELARYYQIELIIDQPEVSDPWLTANFPIRTVEWFEKHADRYDRILYHFGNSEFHKHMFRLLQRHPGVVVLHDFYLSGVLHWMDHIGYTPGVFHAELYRSHGWGALAECLESGEEAAVWKYPCNLSVIQRAEGVIVHSHYATELAARWYGKGIARDWRVIPHLRRLPIKSDRAAARAQLGLGSDDFLVCSFGFIAKTKLSEAILEGWLRSRLARDPRCRLVFVGHSFEPELEAKLRESAKRAGVSERVRITGYVPREVYESYLAAADVAIQLRAKSRGETSGPVLDALARGLPTVINAHGWMAELPDDVVLKLPEEVHPHDVAEALERLHGDADLRHRLGNAGRAYVKKVCDPRRVAEQYFETIEHFAEAGRHARCRKLIRAIAQINSPSPPKDADLVEVAKAIAANLGHSPAVPQLLVDISHIAQQDMGTGIQRVTRTHLKNLLRKPPEGWRVEPVHAAPPSAYRYARAFMAKYFQLSFGLLDDIIEVSDGDIFLGLDWAPTLIPSCLNFFTRFKTCNGRIYFIIYDLLPVRHPEWFPPEVNPIFAKWLEAVAKIADGVVCTSRYTADQLFEWLEMTRPLRPWPLKIGYSHSGADIECAPPLGEKRVVNLRGLETLARSTAIFLMVGTVEPRKGHAQALAAFEELWRLGADISLVIVGKQGWMVEHLAERLRKHPEQGKRLFWLEGASDATLLELYRRSTALLMASQDEGFGLPLIEAARHGLPIVARDIPVFREICGNHAFYFRGDKPEELAEAITTWLRLYREGKAPSVQGMKWLTWEESTQQLLDVILGGKWYRTWEPK